MFHRLTNLFKTVGAVEVVDPPLCSDSGQSVDWMPISVMKWLLLVERVVLALSRTCRGGSTFWNPQRVREGRKVAEGIASVFASVLPVGDHLSSYPDKTMRRGARRVLSLLVKGVTFSLARA